MIGGRLVWRSLAVVPGLLVACGQPDPPDHEPRCRAGSDDHLYPMEDGAWWVHRVVPDDSVATPACKVVSIEAEGELEFRAFSQRVNGHALRYQAFASDSLDVLRHHDEGFSPEGERNSLLHFCPSRFRVPDRDDTSAIVEDSYTEISIHPPEDGAPQEVWDRCALASVDPSTCEVRDLDPACEFETTPLTRYWRFGSCEPITVPAGEIEACLVEVSSNPDLDDPFDPPKQIWWRRGLGKVLEIDHDQVESLVACCLPSAGCSQPAPDVQDVQGWPGCEG